MIGGFRWFFIVCLFGCLYVYVVPCCPSAAPRSLHSALHALVYRMLTSPWCCVLGQASDEAASVLHRANEELAALDCRAAVVEAQAMNDPPIVIKQLLIFIYSIIQDSASPPAASPSSGSRDVTWQQCRSFVRSDDFLDAMFQASPEHLAARADRLAYLQDRVRRDSVTRDAVVRACSVFEPMFDWLHVQLVSAAELIQAQARARASSASSTSQSVSGDDVHAASDEVHRCRRVLDARKVAVIDTSKDSHAWLSAARATLHEVVKLRSQFGLSQAGLWDGGDDPFGTVSEVTPDTRKRSLDPVRKQSTELGESDSKMYTPRRKSVGDASPPSSRPSSRDGTQHATMGRDGSPLAYRVRRASIDSGAGARRDRWGSDSKGDEPVDAPIPRTNSNRSMEDETAPEQWPDESMVSVTMRRRTSVHSNSPLRRQSLVGAASNMLVASAMAQDAASMPSLSATLPAQNRRMSLGNSALDSPQLRRLRVSSTENADADIAALGAVRRPRSSSESASSATPGGTGRRSGDDISPPVESIAVVPSAAATVSSSEASQSTPTSAGSQASPLASGPLGSARRSSVAAKASPLRRKSNIGSGLIDPTLMAQLGDVGGTTGSMPEPRGPETSVQRVRRMSIGAVMEPTEVAPAYIANLLSARTGSSSTSPVPAGSASPQGGSASQSQSQSQSRHSLSPTAATATSVIMVTAATMPVAVMPAPSTSASSITSTGSGRKPVIAQAIPGVPAVTAAPNESFETPVASASRRNSIVQRPSPLRRVSLVDVTSVGNASSVSATPVSDKSSSVTVQRGIHASPEHSRSPELKVFMSPEGSAFKRCLTSSLSPSHEQLRASGDNPSAESADVSPENAAKRSQSENGAEPTLFTTSEDSVDSSGAGFAAAASRVPVRAVRQDSLPVQDSGVAVFRRPLPASLNMDAVYTPSKDGSVGEPGSRPSSARLSLSSGRPSSARRLIEALQYGEEVAVKNHELGIVSPPAAVAASNRG